jgi:hypothetical protein
MRELLSLFLRKLLYKLDRKDYKYTHKSDVQWEMIKDHFSTGNYGKS